MKNLYILFLFVLAHSGSGQVYKTMTGQKWESGAWVNDFRMSNTVDGSGYIIKIAYEGWLTSSNSWAQTDLVTYTNNAAGMIVQGFDYTWDNPNNKWVPWAMQKNTYNANNTLNVDLRQDISSGTPVNQHITNYFYDSKGYLSSYVSMSWQSGAWANNSKATYTNNSGGEPIQILYHSFISGSWTGNLHITYSYHSPGKISEMIAKSGSTSGWNYTFRRVTSYDQFGYLILEEDYNWENNGWVLSGRTTTTNYPDGKIDYSIHESFNGTTWSNYQKVIYTWFGSTPTGITTYPEDLSQPIIYFDVNGRQVEKQKNVLLIEQMGMHRRKVIIQE